MRFDKKSAKNYFTKFLIFSGTVYTFWNSFNTTTIMLPKAQLGT